MRRREFWRRNRRRLTVRRLTVTVIIVVIVGLAGVFYRSGMLSRYLPGGAVPLGRSGATPSAVPTTTTRKPVARVDLNQPFLTTPAAGWADGAAGIVLPQAAPVGSYSAEEVATAMDQVRGVVVAARLDRRVLEGHDPEPYLSLLAPEEAKEIRPYFAPGRERAAQGYAAKVADGYHLLPAEPKVNGTMSTRISDDGQLLVHTNYIFAYAFRPDHPETVTSAFDIVLISRWDLDYEVITGSDWLKSQRGVSPKGGAGGHSYAVSCTLSKKGFLAPSFSDRRVDQHPAEQNPDIYFDPNRPLPQTNGCPD
jgi:hypothetical protein